MKKIFDNLKDPITDVMGCVIMIMTIVEKYNGKIGWIWEGMAGVAVGFALFMMPDRWIMELLQKISDKFLKDKNQQP
jgi:hypothetical protein